MTVECIRCLSSFFYTIHPGEPNRFQIFPTDFLSAHTRKTVLHFTALILLVPLFRNAARTYRSTSPASDDEKGVFSSTWFIQVSASCKNKTKINQIANKLYVY